jgi:hypothetical protein
MDDEPYAKEFFFAELPDKAILSGLPATGRDVIIARVRIVEGIAYVGGRHEGASPPKRLVAAQVILSARIEVIEVINGTAEIGDRIDVYFGTRGAPAKYKYPHTASMREHDYFIASYIGEEGVRLLLGSRVGREEYERWQEEVYEYERARGQPGYHDK